MPKIIYPLEGDSQVEEVRFYLYDGYARTAWGQVRVRREKNPDVLVLEGNMIGQDVWSHMLTLVPVGDRLAIKHSFIGGGPDDRATEGKEDEGHPG